MITIKLLGGLGNQLWQLALSVALESRGYQTQFDKSALVEGTHREYSLGFLDGLSFGQPSGPRIHELGMNYNAAYLTPENPSTLIGYFQSWRYLNGIEAEVRHKFNSALWPQKTLITTTEFATAYTEIYRSISIGVHVRRQDYVNLQSFHGMPPIDYYLDAVKQIQCQTLPSKVFVFSDDREWCRQNLPAEWLVVNGINKYDDLRLMSACKHTVIANSSFSWWAAFLGDNQTGRIVIAPARWFADDGMQEQSGDICPERWIRI